MSRLIPTSSGIRAVAAGAILAVVAIGVAISPASADQPLKARNQPQMHGATYQLQNNFSFAGELTPFFDAYSGRVGPKTEIDAGYIYNIDISQRQISMSWNTDAAWDMFEPYVGAIAGSTQAEAAALPLADEYWITFDKPISDMTFTADPTMPLVPNVRTADDYTLVISIPGGTSIGDGFDAVINIER